MAIYMPVLYKTIFIRLSRDGPYYVIGYGGRPHRFLHNNFSSVYRIFTKLDHMISLWKGKNHIYFGVIRSKIKVTITINRILTTGSFPHNFSSVYWIITKLDHIIALWKGKNPIYIGVIRSKVKVTITINIIFYCLIIYIDGRIL
jgi:hypothetical protein